MSKLVINGSTGQAIEAPLSPSDIAEQRANRVAYEQGLPAVTVLMVKAEAERRIEEGTLVNGVLIKADLQSSFRLHGIVTAAGRDPNKTWTFMTDGGVKMTVNKTQAEAIFDAIEAHVSGMLATSATLQELVASMTTVELEAFDPTDNANWP
jgi:hypothetical protein